MQYLTLDTDALDALPPAEAYQAATQVHHQAKAIGAAYADQLASKLAAEHGQVRAAELLGIAQSTVAGRVTRHKERPAKTFTVTEYVPVLKREISRTWTQHLGYWTTDVDGTTWTLHREGSAGGWNGPHRPVWAWGPRGGGQDVPEIKSNTVEGAMKEATWHIDIHPRVEEWQRQRRESQDN